MIRPMRHLAALLAACALAGCANPSTNMRIGNEQPYTSLEAQRAAALTVTIVDALPPGAQAIGPVDASRCHRFQGDIQPSEELLLTDLRAAAYARGADGVFGVQIADESGLLRNCWHILTAKGTMFRKPR